MANRGRLRTSLNIGYLGEPSSTRINHIEFQRRHV